MITDLSTILRRLTHLLQAWSSMRIFSIIFVVLLVEFAHGQISSLEQLAICAFNNNTINFPVPCSDAVNSCSYSSYIKCNSGATSITSIDLYNTLFSPMVMPTEIGNLMSLTYFRAPSICSTNGGALTIPTEIGRCTSLNVLRLNNCNPSYGGTLPKELASCNLTQLTLNSFSLSGTIPSLLLTSNIFLSTLTLSNNPLLGGTVPNSISTLTRLLFIDFASTNLSGTFPDVTGLTRLQILSLSSTYFTGSLPNPAFMPGIQRYSLSNNKFRGSLPLFNIVTSTFLTIGISGNDLTGSIPDNFITTSSITPTIDIRMNNNHFTGTIPDNLFSTINLIALDLNHNQLSGIIPTSIGLRSGLTYLNLGYNNISGSIPSQLGGTFSGLTVVDISYNLLTGSIPINIVLGNVANDYCFLTLNNNQLSGVIPIFGNNGSFDSPTSIDLSHNQLTLDANSFGLNAQNINWLNLAFNNFSTMPRFNWTFDSNTNSQELLTTSIFSVDRFPTLVSLDLTSCSMVGEMPVNLPGNYVRMSNNYFTGIVSHFASGINNQPTFFDFVLNRLDGLETTPSDLFTSITISFLPQDVDECLTNTSECQFFCVDGWFPVPGYTCSCPVGYQLDSNLKNCSPVCGNGIQTYPDKECDFVFSPFGCTFNCTQKPGYQCDSTGCSAICGDNIIVEPEECDITDIGCDNQCRVTSGYSCYNNSCILCSNETFQGVILSNTSQLFPRFSTLLDNIFSTSVFYYQSCTLCQGGRSLETRNVLGSTYCAATTQSNRVQDCSFACSNLTVFSSASQALFILSQELQRGGFIDKIFSQFFGLEIQLVNQQKRQTSTDSSSLIFQINQCDQQNISEYITVIHAISLDIVPNIPQLKITPDKSSNCTLIITSSDIGGFKLSYIGIIIPILLLLFIFLIMSYTIIRYRLDKVHLLPKEINWSFVDYLLNPWKWQYDGNNIAGYYSREFSKEGKKFAKVQDLINTFFHNNDILKIDKIEAIYNKALTLSFITHWNTTLSRFTEDHGQFYYSDYDKDPEKMAVMAIYKERCDSLIYNAKQLIPLIPVLHGTDLTIAEKIAKTGFATLSSLDAGFYGKGIYFTTNLLYTLPYCMGKRCPAVIISYTNMGHVYPVTERMTGQALKNGYNSHYVLTCKDGHIHTERHKFYDDTCDEIIVNQEVQILPAFIVTLNIDSCEKELKNWERVLADEKERYQLSSSLLSSTTTPSSITCSTIIDIENI